MWKTSSTRHFIDQRRTSQWNSSSSSRTTRITSSSRITSSFCFLSRMKINGSNIYFDVSSESRKEISRSSIIAVVTKRFVRSSFVQLLCSKFESDFVRQLLKKRNGSISWTRKRRDFHRLTRSNRRDFSSSSSSNSSASFSSKIERRNVFDRKWTVMPEPSRLLNKL